MVAHVSGRVLAEQEARAHVDVEGEVEVVDAELEERLRKDNAGIVDEHVETAELLDDACDELCRHGGVGEIAGEPRDPVLPMSARNSSSGPASVSSAETVAYPSA